MSVKLLTKQHLEFISLKGVCRGSSESTHVKMSYCWKSHALAQIYGLIMRRLTQAGLDLRCWYMVVKALDCYRSRCWRTASVEGKAFANF